MAMTDANPLFIDTNILAYATSPGSPWHTAARAGLMERSLAPSFPKNRGGLPTPHSAPPCQTHRRPARIPLTSCREERPAEQRGGAWNNNRQNARCAYRNRNNPHNRTNNLGLRVVTPITH